MSAPPPSDSSESSLARLIRTTLQYDTNVMLAAIISLLLVILFVLLLHLYTRWFLVHARRRSRSSVTVPHVLGSRLHHRFTIIDTSTNSDHSSGKSGLPFSIISLLPLFVYKFPSDEYRDYGLDCAICLSVFEEEEIGRKLPGCGHAFHVECIDMWLHSHSTCPICRAAIHCNHSPKIDHLILEIDDPEQNSDALAINDEEEELRSKIVNTISNQIPETREMADVAVEHDGGTSGLSSSSIGETFKKLLSNNSSCSSRSGGKIHPSSNVNGDEPMA